MRINITQIILVVVLFFVLGTAVQSESAPATGGTATAIPFKQEAVVSSAEIFKIAIWLTVLLVLLAVGVVAYKHFAPRFPFLRKIEHKDINMIAIKRMTPKCHIVIAKVQGKQYTLALNDHHIVVLHQES